MDVEEYEPCMHAVTFLERDLVMLLFTLYNINTLNGIILMLLSGGWNLNELWFEQICF